MDPRSITADTFLLRSGSNGTISRFCNKRPFFDFVEIWARSCTTKTSLTCWDYWSIIHQTLIAILACVDDVLCGFWVADIARACISYRLMLAQLSSRTNYWHICWPPEKLIPSLPLCIAGWVGLESHEAVNDWNGWTRHASKHATIRCWFRKQWHGCCQSFDGHSIDFLTLGNLDNFLSMDTTWGHA